MWEIGMNGKRLYGVVIVYAIVNMLCFWATLSSFKTKSTRTKPQQEGRGTKTERERERKKTLKLLYIMNCVMFDGDRCFGDFSCVRYSNRIRNTQTLSAAKNRNFVFYYCGSIGKFHSIIKVDEKDLDIVLNRNATQKKKRQRQRQQQ